MSRRSKSLGWLLAAVLAPPTLAQVAVRLEGGEVVGTGLSPGGPAVVFGVARLPEGFSSLVVRHRELLVADGGGEIRFAIAGGEVPPRSTWAVVDLASGGYALAAPERFGVRRSAALGPAVPASLSGGPAVRFAREAVEVLVVRPGLGAWSLGVRDGAAADRGAEVGAIEAEPGAFEPLGEVAVPFDGPETGDLIIAIDPQRLEMEAVRVSLDGEAP